ncbi:MAG: hypothetical protein Q8O54_12360 [Brevundimonas sp.]|nr:hypothetical protein [Brevundimonas sp.]
MAAILSPVALAAITACVVAAGVGAGIILQPTRDRAVPAARGPNVSIDVVAAREPVPAPGGVMDVGNLANGYSHQVYAQPPAVYRLPRDIAGDEGLPRVAPRRVERPPETAPQPPPPPVIAERPGRWSFGFDAPGPDYAAERRERIARMEERQRFEDERFDERGERWSEPRDDRGLDEDRPRRERQWYRSDGRRVQNPEMFY